jgi:hypothetical protein
MADMLKTVISDAASGEPRAFDPRLAAKEHPQLSEAGLHALHSRFLSDTSSLPEEWQDWRNDFARDIRALVEKGAGNG